MDRHLIAYLALAILLLGLAAVAVRAFYRSRTQVLKRSRRAERARFAARAQRRTEGDPLAD